MKATDLTGRRVGSSRGVRLPEPKAWTLDVKTGEAVISQAQSS